jgi:hypothetical protein
VARASREGVRRFVLVGGKFLQAPAVVVRSAMSSRALFVGIIIILGALVMALNGGLGGQPPERPSVMKMADGRSLYLVEHGPYKAFYDAWGRLDRIEYDSNGDGRADRIALHNGAKQPFRIQVDADFDGHIDRWEDFDSEGRLTRFAVIGDDARPHRWIVVDAKGQATRYDYDEDGDGRIERSEIIEGGRVGRIELDTDHDGRMDRWQTWKNGRLVSEAMDTDGDGTPDRRLVYGADGVPRLERLGP